MTGGAVASLRVVVFDYYETLAELTQPIRERTFDDLARGVGVELPPGEAYRHWTQLVENDAKVRFDGKRPPLDGAAPPFRTFREVWLVRFAALFERWGVNASPEVGAEAYACAHAKARLYPDVRPAIEELHGRYRLVVLSDADTEFLSASIRANDLAFDAVVDSEGVGAYKPHVSLFRAACNRLGAASNEAVYVGDSPWADIAGARNAGLRPVWMNRHGATWPEEIGPPESAVRTLAELSSLLE